MRVKGIYHIEFFYDYYLQKGGKNINIQSFTHIFKMVNLDPILEYLDSVFNLVILTDQNNKIVKCL